MSAIEAGSEESREDNRMENGNVGGRTWSLVKGWVLYIAYQLTTSFVTLYLTVIQLSHVFY